MYKAVRSTALPIFGDPHGPVDRDSRLVLLRIQTRVGRGRGAGAEDIGTRQFGPHDASQGFSHAVDADQQVAFGGQLQVVVDGLRNGLVNRLMVKFAEGVIDRALPARLRDAVP
jgi:hypothetical protein